MIPFVKRWLANKEDSSWGEQLPIKWNPLIFYAPLQQKHDIYSFQLGDVVKDTYTDQLYRAVDRMRKKSRWGEEKDFFIMKSLHSDDQFALEHSLHGFPRLRYHKKYQLNVPAKKRVGYLDLKKLFPPDVRADIRKSSLPHQPGLFFFYDAEYQLLYVDQAASIRDQVFAHVVGKEKQITRQARHHFAYLCYLLWEHPEERHALLYHCIQVLQPQIQQQRGQRGAFDPYVSLFKLDISLEDFYRQAEAKGIALAPAEWKQVQQKIRRLPAERVQNIATRVIDALLAEVQLAGDQEGSSSPSSNSVSRV